MYAHNKVIFGCDRANSKYKVPSCRFFGSQPLKSHIRMVNARSREMSILRMFRIIEHIETLCKSKQKIKFKKIQSQNPNSNFQKKKSKIS